MGLKHKNDSLPGKLATATNAGLVCLVALITLTASFVPQFFGYGITTEPVQAIVPPAISDDKLDKQPLQPSTLSEAAPVQLPKAKAGSSYPAQLINLLGWKLTLPIDTPRAGSPDEVTQPELAAFSLNPYFRLNDSKNGVIFQAHAGGATTKGSNYPRSELREMNGSRNASWSSNSGTHTMVLRQSIRHNLTAKPEVVVAQIHGGSDDVMQVKLEGNQLKIVYDDGKTKVLMDGNYVQGTPYDLVIKAYGSMVDVTYNGTKFTIPASGNANYFKAGAYVQSNPSKGDSPDAFGQVIIYRLQVSHT